MATVPIIADSAATRWRSEQKFFEVDKLVVRPQVVVPVTLLSSREEKLISRVCCPDVCQDDAAPGGTEAGSSASTTT